MGLGFQGPKGSRVNTCRFAQDSKNGTSQEDARILCQKIYRENVSHQILELEWVHVIGQLYSMMYIGDNGN